MTAATNDDDFPVLSDVLDSPTPTARPKRSAPVAAVASAKPATLPPAPPPAPSSAAPALTAAELEQFEQAVRDQIMNGLNKRVDVMLQLRIDEIVQEVVGQTILTLAEELKQSLKNSLADIVQRAVAEEMGRVRTRKQS